MGDKSPHDSKSKKSGKSLKEKRADKRAKADAATQHAVVIVPAKKS